MGREEAQREAILSRCRETQATCKACHWLHCRPCSSCVKGILAQNCFWDSSAPSQQPTEHMLRSPEVLVRDPNKSLELLGKRKETPEIPAG